MESPDLNTRIKMAQKSAYVDAVKRYAGISDLFSQDDPEAAGGEVIGTDTGEANFLKRKAGELFGEAEANSVLNMLAVRAFQIPDGDWSRIPKFRLQDAVRRLTEKAKTLKKTPRKRPAPGAVANAVAFAKKKAKRKAKKKPKTRDSFWTCWCLVLVTPGYSIEKHDTT